MTVEVWDSNGRSGYWKGSTGTLSPDSVGQFPVRFFYYHSAFRRVFFSLRGSRDFATISQDWTLHYGGRTEVLSTASTLDRDDPLNRAWWFPLNASPWLHSTGTAVTVALTGTAPRAQEEPENAAPTVTIAAGRTTVAPGGRVALAARASDTDGTITSYVWTAIRGGTFSTTTEAETVWTAPERPSRYPVRVTVNDNRAAIAQDTVTITVEDEEPTVEDPEEVPTLPAAGLAALAFLLAACGARQGRARAVPPTAGRRAADAHRPR